MVVPSLPQNSVTGEQLAAADVRAAMAVMTLVPIWLAEVTSPLGTMPPLLWMVTADNLGSELALAEQAQRFPVVPAPTW